MYDTAFKFQNFAMVCIFFISFHFMVNLVILSLLKGLIWEIFTVVETETEKIKQLNIKQAEFNKHQILFKKLGNHAHLIE